jgi:hypothetical protein
MPGTRPDPTSIAVLSFLKSHANSEGVVKAGKNQVAAALAIPVGTAQNALGRLQKRDQIWILEHGKYVIVDLTG